MVRRGWRFDPASSTVFPSVRLQRDPPPATQRSFKGNIKEGNPEEHPNRQPNPSKNSSADTVDNDAVVGEMQYYLEELRTAERVLLKLKEQMRDEQLPISAQKLQQNISYQEDLKEDLVLKIEALNQK